METWVAVDKNGTEICSNVKPEWCEKAQCWFCAEEMCSGEYYPSYTELPKGSIEKLLGYKLNQKDGPKIIK